MSLMHGIIHLDHHAIGTMLARWVVGALLPTRLTRGRSNGEERRCGIQAVLSVSLNKSVFSSLEAAGTVGVKSYPCVG